MKVTKEMIDRAYRNHFNSESYSSLVKAQALEALYKKQRGQKVRPGLINRDTKTAMERIETRKSKPRKKQQTNSFGMNLGNMRNLGFKGFNTGF